jgi:hypothetical protein
MTLDREDVEAIARRVAELLRADPAADAQYVDASTIARRFGVTRAWVYQHKSRLGAVPLGSGPKPRLRFDITRVPELLGGQRDTSPPRRRGRPARAHSVQPPAYRCSSTRAAMALGIGSPGRSTWRRVVRLLSPIRRDGGALSYDGRHGVVARPTTGSVRVKVLADGTRSFELRFAADSARQSEFVHERFDCPCCGGGWSEARAHRAPKHPCARVGGNLGAAAGDSC